MNAIQPNTVKKPAFRSLKAYAFDPSLSLKIDTAGINQLVYKVPWEDLDTGPSGEYIEVVDYDPTVKKYFKPVDLNHPYLLAQNGLDPSESNPQFHQQMVYAVAMTTIMNFEKALGRKILWAPRLLEDRAKFEEYVQKLRIYPHALREANAYYSPVKKSLLFGYFSSFPANNVIHMPDALVFTCLSHDIIAHETTHAILDGMQYHYNEPSNPDVLAFHEAFADIVALFQHFTFPSVLQHQIAQTRGDLGSQNLLGKLAQEFGAAIGNYGSLRDAIGEIDEKTKEWKPREPNPNDYKREMEPHARGSILVAAVFEAFITIYKSRVADLLRIATNGTGILPQGDLHPDLVNRLSGEASAAASHVLSMCIRALDYCPPVDITFGEYLRAIITADADLVNNDSRNYRLAFIDAFRRRGIYPEGIKTLSEESLRYAQEPFLGQQQQDFFGVLLKFLKEFRDATIYTKDRAEIYRLSKSHISGSTTSEGLNKKIVFSMEDPGEFEKLTGLVFLTQNWEQYGVRTSPKYKGPSFRIENLRLVSRVGPDGDQLNYIIFSLTQRAGVIVNEDGTISTYVPDDAQEPPKRGFECWGGCTMIFDMANPSLRYAITKPLLDPDKLRQGIRQLNEKRILKQFRYQTEEAILHLSEQSLYFGAGINNNFNEPFAFLHNH
ncbi:MULTISPECIES: gluzincin family metallopeptidase [Niastella]|uniref:Peptidase M4 n=1 Tax=Niastella soli TaxID=2821487 RepID=A0ABS3YX15_9BACT|nr:hypothetical protein [Niastella soli]MBO9202413.1 hypothetical protein [Niastella soli]